MGDLVFLSHLLLLEDLSKRERGCMDVGETSGGDFRSKDGFKKGISQINYRGFAHLRTFVQPQPNHKPWLKTMVASYDDGNFKGIPPPIHRAVNLP
jgi:hypothetical protein